MKHLGDEFIEMETFGDTRQQVNQRFSCFLIRSTSMTHEHVYIFISGLLEYLLIFFLCEPRSKEDCNVTAVCVLSVKSADVNGNSVSVYAHFQCL